MQNEWADILSDGAESPITDRQLLEYLGGRLGDPDSHQLEKAMQAGNMESDALEGLLLLNDRQRIAGLHAEINKGLHDKLRAKAKAKKRYRSHNLALYMLLTAALIALALLAWFIIKFTHMQP